MTERKVLAVLLTAALSGAAVAAYPQKVVTLEEIFAGAERHSAQLRPYLTAREEAESEIKTAEAAKLPDISASLSLSFIGDGFTTRRDLSDCRRAPIPHFGSGLGVSVEQPVYAGGAITNGIRMAELKSTAARYRADLQRDNIRFSLTGYYLDIYKYTNLRRVIESNLTAAREVLREMNARFSQGTALRNDITRYELLVANLELQLTKTDNLLKILNNNLVTLAGLDDGTVIVPDSTILSRSLPCAGEQAWQTTAGENAVSLKLARTGIDISRKAEELVRTERLPKVGLQASWSINGPILVEIPPINRNLSYWYVGVGVSYDLSSLYKTGRKERSSRIATRKAEEEYASVSENLTNDIRNSYISYMEAYEELRTREKSVELADRNYSVTFTRYSNDMALITDMLDAANSRLDAQQQLVNARIDIIYQYYKLLFISGII